MLRRALLSALLLATACTQFACSGGGGLVSTPTPAPSPTVDPPHSWLTAERQQLLVDTLKALAPDNGWVAGCVFEKKADQNIFTKVQKPAGRAFYSEFTNPALGAALAARVEGTTAGSGEFVGFAPDGATYCYLPK